MRFLVRIYGGGGNYSAMAPDVLGCVAAADTIEETRDLMAEAIGLHLEMMQSSGEKMPTPRHSTRFEIDDSSDEEFCTWVDAKIPEPAILRNPPAKAKSRRQGGKKVNV